MRCRSLLSLVFVVLMASACSTKMAYFSAQEMQRAQCDKQTDLQELQRCRAQIKQSYDDYQRQREEINKAE